MRSLYRSWLSGLAYLGLLAAVACQPEDHATPTMPQATMPADFSSLTSCDPTDTDPGGTAEGEIFGSVYSDGDRACADPEEVEVTLTRLGPGSVSNYNPDLAVSSAFPLMWEYWDIDAGDGPCSSTPRASETSHATYVSAEQHCVRPGSYTFTGPSASGSGSTTFDVDYLQHVFVSVITNNTPGAVNSSTWIMRPDSDITSDETTYMSTGGYHDLVINRDIGSASYSDTPALDIDATSTPHTGPFTNQSSPSGIATDWFRFSVDRSSSTWSTTDAAMNGRGRALAKIWYRESGTSTWLKVTNYFDYRMGDESYGLLRLEQFAGPATCPASARSYEIGLELMRPDEDPANAPTTTRTISVACPSGYAAPTLTGASSVGSTSATINWSNGTSLGGATTEIERNDGGGWISVASGLPIGSYVSYPLTGLTPSTTYSIRIRHDLGGIKTGWTTASNHFTTTSVTITAPSSLSASSITGNSATLSWTNGTTSTGVTTRIEYGPTLSYGSTISGIGAGVTSQGLSGLSANTLYYARARHDSAGYSSSWTTSSFTTDDEEPPPEVTSFSRTSCDRYFSFSKWRITHDLGWTVSGSTSGYTWQIREAETNDSTAGSITYSGSLGLSKTIGEYLEYEGPLNHYFWIRYTGASNGAWFPLADNALEVTACEA